jgi:hypothetical protein
MDNGRGQQSTGEGAQQKPPYGFYLVLAAIVVVAIMYSVTILLIGDDKRTPETVFGAMAASFTVIGTLVGTYFGIKAGLDGQDKLKDTVGKANGGSDNRPLTGARMHGDQTNGKQHAEGQSGGRGETRVVKRGDPDKQQGWAGESV